MPVKVKSEFREAILQFLLQIEKEIIQNTIQAGQVATGKTIQSFEVAVTDERGVLLAAPYVMVLEDGRGPTRRSGKGPGTTLQQKIEEWMKAKGIVPKDISQSSLAYIIARKIHNEGTRLYRRGGKSGVISNVITEQRIDSFMVVYADKFAQSVRSEIFEEVNR